MNTYTQVIRQWALDTRRTGFIANADGTGEVGLKSSEVGRRLAVRFTLKAERDRVIDARYEVFGCGFSMAACAVAADMVVGYTLDEVKKIDAKTLDQALEGLPSERGYCAELAAEALQAAVQSLFQGRTAVATSVTAETEHGARVTDNDPVYRALMATPEPDKVSSEDRHLVACLASVAAQESYRLADMVGLQETEFETLLTYCFPGISLELLVQLAASDQGSRPPCNKDVLAILLRHVPRVADVNQRMMSVCLAHVLAARSSLPGHLWVAMGLTVRAQLSAAIRRHLPSLAAANDQNMRWKRYLYKQVCDLNGGVMCKAPNCGVCSDYNLCFAEPD